jgi:magnesium-transporting ATPase (P-type)
VQLFTRTFELGRHLYEFNGRLTFNDQAETVALDSQRALLRGSALKNTSWVFGVVIYTGHESKLMMNSRAVPLKRCARVLARPHRAPQVNNLSTDRMLRW